MARREYALTTTDMPDEQSIKALPVGAQWLYDRLRFRKEISRCGVLQWRPAVLTELAPDATDRKIRAWAKQLEAGRQVVLDEPYAELLVRTYVRWDGLLAQPNVVPHLVYDFGLIASSKVRLGFLREFRRLWDIDALTDGERGGWLLAVGHFPRRKHAADDPAKWPVALEPATLARLVKAVGTGIREPLTSAIAAGHVEPFDPASPHGIPDPFHPSRGGDPIPPPPTPHGSSRTHVSAPTPTVSENRQPSPSSETETRARVTDPAQPAAAAADTHTPPAPINPDELIANHVGPTTGAVRLGLRQRIEALHNDGLEPTTIAAALTAWAQRPGSGPGLLDYLANDLLLDDRLTKKPRLSVNGDAPPWCGHPDCDPASRWTDTGNGWRRCPDCHPHYAGATHDESTHPPSPEPPTAGTATPQMAATAPTDPPF